MQRSQIPLRASFALLVFCGVPAQAAVKRVKDESGTVAIKTRVSAAAFDAKGNLLHMTVNGAAAGRGPVPAGLDRGGLSAYVSRRRVRACLLFGYPRL